MKKIISLTLTTLIVGSIFSTTQAEDNEKYYEVTENGKFQYIYRAADVVPKTGIKPVTDRTFYLETMRNGLLPANLSYREYQDLTPEEIQALLNQAPLGTVTSGDQYIAVEKINVKDISTTKDFMNYPEDAITTKTQISPQNREESFKKDLPWIVDVTVDPTNGYKLPEEFTPFVGCIECAPVQVPQVVNDILVHGEKTVSSSALVWEPAGSMIYTAGK